MSLKKLITHFNEKMQWYDVPILKLTVFFATLFLLTAWPAFRELLLGIDWYWYLGLTLIMMFYLMKKM